MSKYWCKHCAVFVDGSKFGKQQHEVSSRHKRAIQFSINKLHTVNKIEKKSEVEAQRELDRINKELGRPKTRIENSKKEAPAKRKEAVETEEGQEIGEWAEVTVVEKPPVEETAKKVSKTVTVGDKETQSWDLQGTKKIQLDDLSDLEDLEVSKFKKTKFKKKSV
ncbi:hypothetical protein BABINDRAFT_177603 [Babjeviella inositovora NRRL Y-12698]|uniref:U1-C C2H2-type zinc finger domain-containing protein n=1 Tax=Babjeviella inositovora NRRL Y-12698 TaxID=984486 RepID=A0A1E3QJZ3_9ASCO|nr:uncharacterized protein BABINDRAFT_177603 [Babjeviella inositovora NRRL Y-12698]ODQ78015.1 hypothetical protein BABINDRAFT_177603 [Babjeviella inositovora NRRL Y-12698]